MIMLWDKIILRFHFLPILCCSDLVFLNSKPFLNCFPFSCALFCVCFDVILSLNSAADTFLLICFTQFKILNCLHDTFIPSLQKQSDT